MENKLLKFDNLDIKNYYIALDTIYVKTSDNCEVSYPYNKTIELKLRERMLNTLLDKSNINNRLDKTILRDEKLFSLINRFFVTVCLLISTYNVGNEISNLFFAFMCSINSALFLLDVYEYYKYNSMVKDIDKCEAFLIIKNEFDKNYKIDFESDDILNNFDINNFEKYNYSELINVKNKIITKRKR